MWNKILKLFGIDSVIPKKKPEKIVFPLSEYVMAYPYAFEKFGEEFGDPEGWDELFVLRKSGINWLLRKFFAENGIFMEQKKSAIVNAVDKKIEKAGFTVILRKDGNYGDELYKRDGFPTLVAAESIETAFAYVNEILRAKEAGEEPILTKNINPIVDWDTEFERMNREALDSHEKEMNEKYETRQ